MEVEDIYVRSNGFKFSPKWTKGAVEMIINVPVGVAGITFTPPFSSSVIFNLLLND